MSSISVEALQSLYNNLQDDLGKEVLSFGYGDPVLGDSFENCAEYLRIMKERRKDSGRDNDIMATIPEFRLSVQNTLRRLRNSLSRMILMKFCEATDNMRAGVPVQLVEQPRGSRIVDRFADVLDVVTRKENITMDELVEICEWIPRLKNEVKAVYMRLRDTLEYGNYVVDMVSRTEGSGPLHTRFPIDRNKILKDVNIGWFFCTWVRLHDFDTLELPLARDQLYYLKSNLNYDAEHVAVLLGRTEARPGRWSLDTMRTNRSRSNAAHTLLELR